MSDKFADIKQHYENELESLDRARDQRDRSYGGRVRSAKGKLTEEIARKLIRLAWFDLGAAEERLSFERHTYKLPLKDVEEYLKSILREEVKTHIRANREKYFYRVQTDIHLQVDGSLVMGVECKAYAENAMLKRVLIDFMLLRRLFPNLDCVLLMLESQLGGDFAKPANPKRLGSPSTHVLLSYLPVDLGIIALVEGERKVDRPIHKPEFFKPLSDDHLQAALEGFKSKVEQYV